MKKKDLNVFFSEFGHFYIRYFGHSVFKVSSTILNLYS